MIPRIFRFVLDPAEYSFASGYLGGRRDGPAGQSSREIQGGEAGQPVYTCGKVVVAAGQRL